MKHFFVTCFLLFFISVHSQITISKELGDKLQGKESFREVWQTVNDHYQTLNLDTNKVATREFKKWNRWAWWAARNIDENGRIINDHNQVKRAFDKINTNSGSRSNTGSWNPLLNTTFEYKNGNIIGTGRVDRITFHPTDANTIYIGSSGGGLWRTQDDGVSWYCLTNTLPNCGVTGVAVDPANTNRIYIATGDGDTGDGLFVSNFQFRKNSYGILVTNNNGDTWNVMGNSQTVMGNRRPYKLIKLNGFTNRFICGTTSGLMISIDNGNTWTLVNNTWEYFDIEQDPDDNNIVFASSTTHILKSTNGGETFNLIPTSSFTPFLSSCARSAIAFNASNNNELFFAQYGTNLTNDRLYRSTDSGNSFNAINTTVEISDNGGTYMGPLAVNGSAVLTGAVNLFRSTDGGVTFTNSTNWSANSTYSPQFIHADIHDIALSPLNNNIYAATDGGVFRSNDQGSTWSFISHGLNTLQFYHMDGIDGDASTYAGGFQDNGSAYSTNSGVKMDFFGSGDGYQVKFIPNATHMIYFVANQSIMKHNRTTNANTTLLSNLSWFPKIACHPTNNQIAYFGTSGSIYKTVNQGSLSFIIANIGASNNASSHAGGLATTAANGDYVYAADESTVYKSTDQAMNWTTISGNPGWLSNFTAITDISSCNGSQDILYVTTNSTTSAKVLFTQDGGSTWDDITGTLPSAAIVYSVAAHDNGDAYIGTNLGVFYQGITMTDWIPFNNGLPLIEVSDLFINESDNKITASTFGRGMWQSDLYTNCSPFVSLSGIVSGYNRYQSSGNLISTQNMNGNYGNDLIYRANSSVQLLPGFTASIGSDFQGKIEPCGQGVYIVEKKTTNK